MHGAREPRHQRLFTAKQRSAEKDGEQELAARVLDEEEVRVVQPERREREEHAEDCEGERGDRGGAMAAAPDEEEQQRRDGNEREERADRGQPFHDGHVRRDREGDRDQHRRRRPRAPRARGRHFVLRSATWAARLLSERKMCTLSWSSSFSLKP